MRPLIYSVKDSEETNTGWQRECFNVAYYQTARLKKVFKNQNSSQFRGASQFTPSQIVNANTSNMQ